MKIKNIITILLFTVILVSCSPATKIIPENTERSATATLATENFFFVFKGLYCGTNILDTKNGTLAHALLEETAPTTIPLQLSTVEMNEVFQKIVAMDFFSYPADFVIPDGYKSSLRTPTGTYELSVTNGESTKTVRWTTGGSFESEYEKANQLWELLMFIQSAIYNHPEYKQLPKSKLACI